MTAEDFQELEELGSMRLIGAFSANDNEALVQYRNMKVMAATAGDFTDEYMLKRE